MNMEYDTDREIMNKGTTTSFHEEYNTSFSFYALGRDYVVVTHLLGVQPHPEVADALDGRLDVRLLVGLDVDVALDALGRHHRLDLQRLLLVGERDELGHQLHHGGTLLADPTLDHPQVGVPAGQALVTVIGDRWGARLGIVTYDTFHVPFGRVACVSGGL